jgi:serine/threonine-protein kinase haspin
LTLISSSPWLTPSQHRDLHENNICVIQKKKVTHINPKKHGSLKFGFSGIELTIIDYGLSRAKLNSGEIAFNDLEQDLELFQGPESGEHKMQFDTYRR